MITSQRNVCRWVDEGLREVSCWLMETENDQEGGGSAGDFKHGGPFHPAWPPNSTVQAFEARDAPSELSQSVSQSRRSLLANDRQRRRPTRAQMRGPQRKFSRPSGTFLTLQHVALAAVTSGRGVVSALGLLRA